MRMISYLDSMKSRVTERGQITIPKKFRERLGIRPGQIVDFQEEEGRLVITRQHASDPLDEVFGILSSDRPTDELMAQLRGDSDA